MHPPVRTGQDPPAGRVRRCRLHSAARAAAASKGSSDRTCTQLKAVKFFDCGRSSCGSVIRPALGRTLDCLSIENVTFCTATFMAHDGIPAESGGHEMSRRRTSRRDPLGEDMKYVVYDILYQGFSSSGYLTFNFVPLRFPQGPVSDTGLQYIDTPDTIWINTADTAERTGSDQSRSPVVVDREYRGGSRYCPAASCTGLRRRQVSI